MKPPLTNPPPGLEWGADYDTPQSYARIGRALMLFLFNAAIDGNSKERTAWLCEGVNRVNGARLIDEDGLTHDPTAHESHWMNPRGSWGIDNEEDEEEFQTEAEYQAAKAVEWRCGWCGAENDTAKAKAPCGWGNGPRRVTRS
jgi:hypothetical protein